MVFPSSTTFTEAGGRQMRGGVDERDLHPGSGLRSVPFSFVAPHTATSGAWTFSSTAVGSAAAFASFAEVTGMTNGLYKNRYLPVPSTLAFTYIHPASSNPEVQFRISGRDQFGNPIQETLPTVTGGPGWTNVTLSFLPKIVQWSSKVFSYVEKIEARLGANTTDLDILTVGVRAQWDRCQNQALVFNDATGGDFTLTVTYPDGTQETTGAIAHGAAAGTVETALEALTGITAVSVALAGSGTAGKVDAPWWITFEDPLTLDYTRLTANDAGLTGETNGTTITGDQFRGVNNVGVGLPVHVYPYGPGVPGNLFPEVLSLVSINHSRTDETIAWSAVNDLESSTISGYRLGHSETGYEGCADKLGILYDSRLQGFTRVPIQTDSGGGRFLQNNIVVFHGLFRTSVGTTRMPTDVNTYPNG